MSGDWELGLVFDGFVGLFIYDSYPMLYVVR